MSTDKYRQALQSNRFSRLKCPRCNDMIVLHLFTRHITNRHSNISTKYRCIWCLEYIWYGRVTNGVNDHRLQCLLERLRKTEILLQPTPLTPPSPTSFFTKMSINNTHVNCAVSTALPNNNAKCLRLYLHKNKASSSWQPPDDVRVTQLRYNSALVDAWFRRTTWVLPPTTISLYCTMLAGDDNHHPDWLTNNEGVDPANMVLFANTFPMDVAACGFDPLWQRLYLYKCNLSWYHIRVRYSKWPAFLHFCSVNDKHLVFLPYSCLCKGGQEHHRHMLCVVLKCHAKRIMQRHYRNVTGDHSKCRIELKPEEQPGQLMATIDNLANGDSPLHYFSFQNTMPYVQLFGMMYMPKGIESYLQAVYSKKYPYNCKSLRHHDVDATWSVDIRDIFPEKALVFPVPRNMYFTPYDDMSSSMLFLGAQKKFSVLQNDDLLEMTDLQWNSFQIEHGNYLLGNFGDSGSSEQRITMAPKIQQFLDIMSTQNVSSSQS